MNNSVERLDEESGWDFRSKRFCVDALALARLTGSSLAQSRQELFIAEGDTREAYRALVSGGAAACVLLHLH